MAISLPLATNIFAQQRGQAEQTQAHPGALKELSAGNEKILWPGRVFLDGLLSELIPYQ